MTRRKGEYSKSRLDREFPHQVIVPADRCSSANRAVIESLCRNLTLGPRHHSLFHQDRWHLVYCFADAAHADLFRETFGGETFDAKARGRGMNWHRLRRRSTQFPPSHRTKPVLLSAISHHSSAAWLQVLTHSSSSFRSQAMHPPPPEHWPSPEGRDWRGRKVMEETMRVLTLTELMRLTRIELCDLLSRITTALPDLPEGSAERQNAFINLRNIRVMLARRDFSP